MRCCTRRGFLWSGAAIAGLQFASPLVVGTPPSAPPSQCHFGVNLCGIEFPSKSVPTNAELDYYESRNMSPFRLPLRWEFLQPGLLGRLDEMYIGLFKPLVDYAAKHGQTI